MISQLLFFFVCHPAGLPVTGQTILWIVSMPFCLKKPVYSWVFICFKRLAEKGSDQFDHLCVIAILIGLIQQHVVLIEQDDDPAAIMLAEQLR